MSIFYEQGKTAAFSKLGLDAAALHRLGDAGRSALQHAAVGGVLGAGTGALAADEGHGVRGALIGGALGGAGGYGVGAARHPMTKHILNMRNNPQAFESLGKAVGAHGEGPAAYQQAMAAHAAHVQGINNPAVQANFQRVYPQAAQQVMP